MVEWCTKPFCKSQILFENKLHPNKIMLGKLHGDDGAVCVKALVYMSSQAVFSVLGSFPKTSSWTLALRYSAQVLQELWNWKCQSAFRKCTDGLIDDIYFLCSTASNVELSYQVYVACAVLSLTHFIRCFCASFVENPLWQHSHLVELLLPILCFYKCKTVLLCKCPSVLQKVEAVSGALKRFC